MRVNGGAPLDDARVKKAIRDGESAGSATDGRLLIRKSGTEPLIRVMAEGEDETLVARGRRRRSSAPLEQVGG